MGKELRKNLKVPLLWPFFLAFFGIAFILLLFLRKKERVNEIAVVEPLDLNPRQRAILNILEMRGEVTVEELIEEIEGVSERTFRRDMQKLEKLGLSKKEGNTKGSKYIYLK
jgi:predicted HTH transcriptional regulator